MPTIFGQYNNNIKELNAARRALHKDLEALRETSTTDKKIKTLRKDISSESYENINAHCNELI